jgi:8-oxo-dGTP pyrophosphatase MutT (NUDIX family)
MIHMLADALMPVHQQYLHQARQMQALSFGARPAGGVRHLLPGNGALRRGALAGGCRALPRPRRRRLGAGFWQLFAGRGRRGEENREHAHHAMAPV